MERSCERTRVAKRGGRLKTHCRGECLVNGEVLLVIEEGAYAQGSRVLTVHVI